MHFYKNQIFVVGAAEKAALENGGGWIGKRVGRPRADLGLILDALFYRLRNAGPWRDLPERFGPWQTVHGWHSRWAANGLWTRLLKTLANRFEAACGWSMEATFRFIRADAIPTNRVAHLRWEKRAAVAIQKSWRSPIGEDA